MASSGFGHQRDKFLADIGTTLGGDIGFHIGIEVGSRLLALGVPHQRDHQFLKAPTLANRLDTAAKDLDLVSEVSHQHLADPAQSAFASLAFLYLALTGDGLV